MSNFIVQNFAGSDGAKWFIGVVEDRNDPLQMGRLRVRIHGAHVDDKSLIPTSELPWAMPVMPLTGGGVSGVGSTVDVMIGACVVGFWLDWPDCQMPAIWGTFPQIEGTPGAPGTLHQQGNRINDVIQNGNVGGAGTIVPTGEGPQWLRIARGELAKGVAEWKGSSHNPEVLKYGKDLGFTTDDSEHPWCSAFVRWCLKNAGANVTGITGLAKSSLTASGLEPITEPVLGCVAVYTRDGYSKSSIYGHVGFWLKREGGIDTIISGNTGDRVAVSTESVEKCCGYRWPRGFPRS